MGAERRNRTIHDSCARASISAALVRSPRLDGRATGDGMQNPFGFFPQGIPTSIHQMISQFHHHVFHIVHFHIGRDCAHQHGGTTKIIHFQTRIVEHGQVLQNRLLFCRSQVYLHRDQQHLCGDISIILGQFFKKNPLVGCMLVDKTKLPLPLGNNVSFENFPHQFQRFLFGRKQRRLLSPGSVAAAMRSGPAYSAVPALPGLAPAVGQSLFPRIPGEPSAPPQAEPLVPGAPAEYPEPCHLHRIRFPHGCGCLRNGCRVGHLCPVHRSGRLHGYGPRQRPCRDRFGKLVHGTVFRRTHVRKFGFFRLLPLYRLRGYRIRNLRPSACRFRLLHLKAAFPAARRRQRCAHCPVDRIKHITFPAKRISVLAGCTFTSTRSAGISNIRTAPGNLPCIIVPL